MLLFTPAPIGAEQTTKALPKGEIHGPKFITGQLVLPMKTSGFEYAGAPKFLPITVK